MSRDAPADHRPPWPRHAGRPGVLLLAVLLGCGASTPPAHAGPDDRRSWTPPVVGALVRAADLPGSAWAAGHRGIDLLAPPGADVVAPADGVVSFTGRVAGRDVVVVEHAGGLRSSFEPVVGLVAVGTRVSAGEPVGTLDAGPGHCAPRSCVHWGVRLGDRYIDPAALLARPRVVLLPPRART